MADIRSQISTLRDVELLRQELDVWLCRYGLSGLRDVVRPMMQPTIALQSVVGYSSPNQLTPHLGGRPALPEGTEWPMSGGAPMAYLGRLDFEKLSAVDPTGLLPLSGRLMLWGRLHDFALWNDGWHASPRFLAMFRDDEPGTWHRHESPWSKEDSQEWFGNDDGYLPACWLRTRPHMTLPDNGDLYSGAFRGALSELKRAGDSKAWDRYHAMIKDARAEASLGSSHQLLGWPKTWQGDPRENPDDLVLLAIDLHSWTKGEGGCDGMCYFMISPDALAERDFSGMTVTTQVD